MQNTRHATNLPIGSKETLPTPAGQSAGLPASIELAGSHAMNTLKSSANILIDSMQKSNGPKEICDLANALATTIQTQTNVVKALMEFKKLTGGN